MRKPPKHWSKNDLKKNVSRLLNKTIRLESATDDGYVTCVTCGKTGPLGNGFDAGHWPPHGGKLAIKFCEDAIAVQCVACNRYHHGEQAKFREWMIANRGEQTVRMLEELKHAVKTYSTEELEMLRVHYLERIAKQERRLGIR